MLRYGLDFPILQKEIGEQGAIVGVDLAIQMLHHAKKKYSTLPLVRADAAHLPFRDRVFDVIVLTFCLCIPHI